MQIDVEADLAVRDVELHARVVVGPLEAVHAELWPDQLLDRVWGYDYLGDSRLVDVAIGRVRRNMPDPVPAVLLGRLAIDRIWQGKGLGGDLLRDAILRVVASAKIIGVRALLVHAISEDAKTFYAKHGFRESPVEAMTLMITIDEAQKLISPPSRSK